MSGRAKPMLNGEQLPADWFTADRAVHEDDALAYRDALVTRSRQGRTG